MFKMNKVFLVVVLCILVISSIGFAQDKWEPTQPITLIVPSKPGGGHDNTARAFAKSAEKYTGVAINVLNESAGGGVVAFTNILQAKPDGYTIGQGSISLVTDQYLVPGAVYNQDSFKYICTIASDPNNLIVKKDGPFGNMSLEEFIAYAKENPKKVRIGVSGNWTNHDYVRYQIEQATGVEFQRVSIKGGANIVMAILAGDLDCGVPYPSEIRGQVMAGKLKILALSGSERLSLWPDVPTFEEEGLDVNLTVWRTLVVPPETPDNIVQGLYEIFKKTMNDPETIKTYENIGIGYIFKGPEETRQMINNSHDRYKLIIDEAGLSK